MGAVIFGEGAVTNLDFHRDGKFLVMSTNESSIHLIDALAGVERKKIYTKSHGIGKIKCTHHEYSILVSSERKSHDIRNLCLYDNRYVRYYKGHTDMVTSISISPTEDYFVSASNDSSVKLWNLSSPHPIATMNLPVTAQRPFVSYDSSGLVFGVLCYDDRSKSHSLRLFDARSYEHGPFQDIAPKNSTLEKAASKINLGITQALQTQRVLSSQWNSFEFSPDGLKILVNTQSEFLFLVDSFNADAEPSILCRKNDSGCSLGACFSGDAQFVATGNDENEIQVFDVESGEVRATLTGHVAPVGSIRCNPRYDVMAAGCINTALWIQPE
jgi:COMPASS component SWD2